MNVDPLGAIQKSPPGVRGALCGGLYSEAQPKNSQLSSLLG